MTEKDKLKRNIIEVQSEWGENRNIRINEMKIIKNKSI